MRIKQKIKHKYKDENSKIHRYKLTQYQGTQRNVKNKTKGFRTHRNVINQKD